MKENTIVIVVEKGMVTEVFSRDEKQKIIVVDEDNRKVGEQFITEFTWPETQFDSKRVTELLKTKRYL